MFLLCKEFGWTPNELKQQDARDVERLIVVMNEVYSLQRLDITTDGNETTIIVDED